jgi:hypothetical protein
MEQLKLRKWELMGSLLSIETHEVSQSLLLIIYFEITEALRRQVKTVALQVTWEAFLFIIISHPIRILRMRNIRVHKLIQPVMPRNKRLPARTRDQVLEAMETTEKSNLTSESNLRVKKRGADASPLLMAL